MTSTFQDRMQVLRQAFAASLAGDVQEAHDLFRSGDRLEAGALVHRIAGRAGTFGAPEVSETASRIEQLLPEGEPEHLEAAFAALILASCAAVEGHP
jgi:HPt (histidine-containing phosphotransfer) domain-containing protein